MKLFDPRAGLAKIQNQDDPPATSATSATQAPHNARHVAKVASVAAPKPETSDLEGRPDQDDFRHGFSAGGRPRTWTGRVVSLEEWRRLSDREKHGLNGAMLNGSPAPKKSEDERD